MLASKRVPTGPWWSVHVYRYQYVHVRMHVYGLENRQQLASSTRGSTALHYWIPWNSEVSELVLTLGRILPKQSQQGTRLLIHGKWWPDNNSLYIYPCLHSGLRFPFSLGKAKSRFLVVRKPQGSASFSKLFWKEAKDDYYSSLSSGAAELALVQ